MTSNRDPADLSTARPRSGRVWLVLALAWVALARVPLVWNAADHLDSDLAVDGLALIDALEGHWRWHYPATPFIGSPPVLLSWAQAKLRGPTPSALVSGGVVAYGLVVLGTYWLNRRAFGPKVAAWGLIPLAFASTGIIWLSGRITGGHLVAAAWHAGAFALLAGALSRGGWRRAAGLGLWCGFGLYLDSMFAVTWLGIGVAALVWAFSPLPPGGRGEADGKRGVGRTIAGLLAFVLASGVGILPRLIGARVDPHDAYVGQFEPILRPDHLATNARILRLDCLPRLVAGHRLPGLKSEPDPSKLGAHPPPSRPAGGLPWWEIAASALACGLFGWAMMALSTGGTPRDPAQHAIRLGLVASILAVVAGFLVYPSISNSDHYRYLVTLIVPWSTGFGLAMARLASKGRGGLTAAVLLGFAFAAVMAVDSARWYDRFGWLDPTHASPEDPVVAWLDDHPEVSTILGDYWDVYRISFLTRGRVKGVPFPQYPDRFPEIRRGWAGASHPVVIVRGGPFGPRYRDRALRAGGRELLRTRGLSIVEWPGGLTP